MRKLHIYSCFSFLQKHAVSIILISILLLTLLLRAWGLGNNPFVADEFIDMNASYGYHQTNTWKAWDFNLSQTDTLDPYAARDERSWIYRWQVAQLFSIFPATETTARSISVIWGLLTTLVIFWSARIFTKDTRVALLSAFLFAVSITGIEYDRKLRMYAMFTPIFLILSTWLFLFLESKFPFKKPKLLGMLSGFFGINFLYLVPVIIIGLLSLHLQLLTVNIAFSLFGYFVIVALLSQYKKIAPSISALWGLGTFFVGGVISFLFFPQIPQAILGTSKLFIDNYGYLEKFLRDFQHPLFGALLIVLGFYTLFVTLKKKKQALWLLTSFLVPLLLTMFVWSRAQGTQYIFYLQPFALILTACGITGIIDWIQKNLPTISKTKISFIVFSLAILLLPNYGYFVNDASTYNRGNDPVADYRKVFTYLKKSNTQELHALITRNFRNFYYAEWNTPVLEFGGERADHDLTKEEIQTFICTHPTGFVVIFDNDWNFVSKDGRTYIESTLQKIDSSSVRGAAKVYEWKEGVGCSQ